MLHFPPARRGTGNESEPAAPFMRSAPRRRPERSLREGFVFNGICGVYFLFLAPHVVALVRRDAEPVANETGPAVWLGVLLLAATLLEIRSLPEKLRFVRAALGDRNPGDGGSVALFFLWMFHAAISCLVVVLAAREFGADVNVHDGTPDFPNWLSFLMPVVVIKELYLLLSIWSSGKPSSEHRYIRPNASEFFHDVVLVSYACLAYSATWGLVAGDSLGGDNGFEVALNACIAGILFLIFYLPMRIPYLLEEGAMIRTRGDRLRFVGSLLMAMIPAIWALR